MSKDSNSYSVAGRYRTVRKNLDILGYKQAFSIDSLPLVELLLVDLAQTKETLEHFQSIAKDNLEVGFIFIMFIHNSIASKSN